MPKRGMAPDSFQKLVQEIREVDTGDVARVARTYFKPDRLTVVAVGVLDVQNDLVVNYPDFISVPTDSEIQESLNQRLLTNPDIDLRKLEKDVNAGLQNRYISGIYYYTYYRCCMYMIYLIENHIPKNENHSQKKAPGVF